MDADKTPLEGEDPRDMCLQRGVILDEVYVSCF